MTRRSTATSDSFRALADVGWGTIGTAASKVAAFGAGVVLARAMSPDEYGLYLTWTTAALLATPVLDAGFTPLVFRRASEGGASGLAWRAARQRLGYWTAAMTGGVALALVAGPEVALMVAAAGAIAGSQSHVDVTAAELEGTGRFGSAARLRSMLGLAFLVAALAVTALRPAALGALTALAVSRIAVAVVVSLRHPGPPSPETMSWRDAVMLGATGIAINAYIQSDIVLLALLGVPHREVAVYAVGYSMLFGLQILPAAVGGALFPRVVSRGLSSPRYVHALAVLCLALSSGVAIFILNGDTLFGIFGNYYRANAEIGLPVLILILPVALNMILASSLQGRHRERLVLASSLLTVGINLGLHLLLIPRFGTQGALSATSACEILLLVILSRASRGEGAARMLGLGVVPPVVLVTVLVLLPVSLGVRTIGCGLTAVWFAVLLLSESRGQRAINQ